jgi:hypothetical protein
MAKSTWSFISSSIRESIIRPASKATFSTLNGEIPRAILSAFTNSRQSKSSGNIVLLAVVLPAPLHPAMIYKFLIRIFFQHESNT